MRYWQTALAILAALSTAFADDFKTNDGKEYKDATVTRVEADGIVVRTKGGISKLYFTELSKDVQERYHYDPDKAAVAYAAQVATTQEAKLRADERNKQEKEAYEVWRTQNAERVTKQANLQALADTLTRLQQQEENLLVQIGQAEKAETEARRRWISQGGTYYSDPKEAELPVLRGRLENVREEKQRVRQELERVQHQP